MNILFLGDTIDAAQMLDWTISIGDDATIIGVSGDEVVREHAEKNNINFYSLEEINQLINNDLLHIDLAVSFLYDRIIKEHLINSAGYGCVNFHPAPLPDYRGRAGCSFAIIDHLNEWGCTAHYIDTGIDTGPIIEVRRFPFDWKEETCFSLKKKTIIELKELYKEVIKEIIKNKKIACTQQVSGKGKYISKEKMLSEMEIKPGDDIDAKIQAFWFPPHEGAFITLNGKKYTLVNEVILKNLDDNK